MTITLEGSGLTQMHTRAEWGARRPDYVTKFTPSFGSTVHWEGPRMPTFSHGACASYVRGIQNFHMDSRNWSDVAYTAIICPHGHVYECRWIGNRTGANGTNAGNGSAYALCYLGGDGNPYTPEAERAMHDTITHLRRHGRAGRGVNCHRDWKPTKCPGDVICGRVKAGRYNADAGGSTPIPAPPQTGEDIFMALTDQEQKELLEAVRDIRPTLIRRQGTTYADSVCILLRTTYEKIPLSSMDEINSFKDSLDVDRVIELPAWKYNLYKTRAR